MYAMGLKEMLEAHGHNVAVYAMRYPENDPSEWSGYWPSEMTTVKALSRPFGMKEVRESFGRLLDVFKPEIVHLNNIHTQLSPVVAEIAHSRGIKVVWTLHDYKLLCPRYDCLRRGVELCEECFGSKWPVLRYRCMKNSLPASVIAFGEAVKWNRDCLEECADAFICPSGFIRDKMVQGGFSAEKCHCLCNFIDVEKCRLESYYDRRDYCCFVGRLSAEKGVKTLVEAATSRGNKLMVVGDGPMRAELESVAGANVEFVGRKNWAEVKEILQKAKFMVIPSEWYENNPLSVIESLCLGTPVLGARIGGIPELIGEGCGQTFEPGNRENLAESMDKMFAASFDYGAIAASALSRFDGETYYRNLVQLYREI